MNSLRLTGRRVPRTCSRAAWLLSSWLCGVTLAQNPPDLNGVWQLSSPVPALMKTADGHNDLAHRQHFLYNILPELGNKKITSSVNCNALW